MPLPIPWGNVTNTPVSLGGYGITSVVASNILQIWNGSALKAEIDTAGNQTNAGGIYAALFSGDLSQGTGLTASQIPGLDAGKVTTGVFNIARLATGTPNGAKFVRDDGTLATPSGAGTVTSVAMTVPSWLSVSGSPITGAGTLAVSSASAALDGWAGTPTNQIPRLGSTNIWTQTNTYGTNVFLAGTGNFHGEQPWVFSAAGTTF